VIGRVPDSDVLLEYARSDNPQVIYRQSSQMLVRSLTCHLFKFAALHHDKYQTGEVNPHIKTASKRRRDRVEVSRPLQFWRTEARRQAVSTHPPSTILGLWMHGAEAIGLL